MVELKVRLGPKGQIVIPKIFREAYKMYPEQQVIIIEQEEGVLIKKQTSDPLAILEKVSQEAEKKRKGKKLKIDAHAIYEQYEKRAKRAGL